MRVPAGIQLKVSELKRLRLPSIALPRGLVASSGATALSIDGGHLRVIATKGREVVFWQQIPLPPGALREGWIADPEAFGQTLRALITEQSLPSGRVLWALPGTMAVGRLLSLSLANSSDPRAAVAREAARVMPLNPEDHCLYWQEIQGSAVFALAVRKDAIDGLVRACKVAKIRPWNIDVKPLALTLAVDKLDAVIADVEATSVDVIIVARGVPVMMRSLLLGDEPLEPGYARAKLLDELAIALRLFNEANRGNALESATPIYLTGELADAELASGIAFLTKHPTVEPQTPFECPPGFPAGRFMVDLGLLMKRS